jgi:peroxiredoxin
VAIVLAALVGALIGDVWHLSRPGPAAVLALPAFHGQGHWGPHQRRAPEFTLRDQSGALVSLADQRGQPVLIAFLDPAAGAGAAAEAASLAQAQALVPRARRPVLDVIGAGASLQGSASVERAPSRWHLKPPLQWLSGPTATVALVLAEYGVRHGTAAAGGGTPLYLVDRSGYERAGYLYPFFPTVLASDLERLYRRHE